MNAIRPILENLLVPIRTERLEVDSNTSTSDGDSNNDGDITTSDDTIFLRRIALLRRIEEELITLEQAKELANWDGERHVPQDGKDGRIKQREILERLYHETVTSRQVACLIDDLSEPNSYQRLSETEKARLKHLKDKHTERKNKPSRFVQKKEELEGKSHKILEEAREKNDFNIIVSHFEKLIELYRKEAEYIGYKGSPYDAHLVAWEPGMTTEKLEDVCKILKKELVPIIKKIKCAELKINNDFNHGEYDDEKLVQFCKELSRQIGFDFNTGRIDISSEPACTITGKNDIRVNIPTDANLMGVISYILHEGGHALYAQGYAEEIKDSLIATCPSIAIDEAQAKLYEMIIGRGRPFWIHNFPKLKELFPDELKDVNFEDFYRGINKIEITAERTNDDELITIIYCITRFEIERDLIEGKLEVKGLPMEWCKKIMDYIGVIPNNYTNDILYDDHWFEGFIGYFPTYILGNLYAAQIWNAAKRDIPDLEVLIASGDMKTLREWLREKIHKYGDLKTTEEIIKAATGEGLNPRYYIEHLKEKLKKLYPEAFKT